MEELITLEMLMKHAKIHYAALASYLALVDDEGSDERHDIEFCFRQMGTAIRMKDRSF